jgi:uncharacterized protein (TIGR03435 family)
MNAPSSRAQSNQAKSGSAAGLKFEVASVRPVQGNAGAGASKGPDAGGERGGGGPPLQLDHGRFSYTATLFDSVIRAYSIQTCATQSNCVLLSGGPDWVKKSRFEIRAKVPAGTPDYTVGQFSSGHAPELQLMLQALLADRFNLKIHREKKRLPVYALTVGKKGTKPNFKKAAGDMIQRQDGTFVKDTTLFFSRKAPDDPTVHLVVKNRPIQEFVEALSRMMDRPVLNRTGLKGEFGFTVDYERDADASGNLALVGPSMFTAFQEQLGLKLESVSAPVEVLVIDHADQPSEN